MYSFSTRLFPQKDIVCFKGHEHKVFQHAEKLFSTVQIDNILMEWIFLRTYNPKNKMLLKMFELFKKHGLSPTGYKGEPLRLDKWKKGWPPEVWWRRL